MKDTLEYEILKYLYENLNLKAIEVSDFHTDKDLFKKKLATLSKDKRIKVRVKSNENIIAEITTEGIEKLDKIESESKNNIKSNLEIENLQLQKESAKYFKTLRQKEDEIRNLTRDNLRLGNWDIRLRWYIAVISFIIGFIIKYFIDN
jgi:predicted DNA binding CopG/RHH family protein